jgi:kinesin family protein 5
MEADQENMYINSSKRQINDFINGINVTIFAYGKTGSGKTFSMTGPESVTDSLKDSFTNIKEDVQKLFGIIPRACLDIFEGINAFVAEGCQVKLTTSYIETYMEKVYDLLSKDRTEIILKYSGDLYYMPGIIRRECMTPEEIFKVISDGTANKKTASTKQNARSSRSHTILIIEIEKTEASGSKVVSKLFLVDLAGSERVNKIYLKFD